MLEHIIANPEYFIYLLLSAILLLIYFKHNRRFNNKFDEIFSNVTANPLYFADGQVIDATSKKKV